MLEGTLKIVLGGQELYLKPGDSMYYDSSLPHAMYAPEGDCRFIAVVDQGRSQMSMKPLYEQYLDCPLTYATYDDFNKRFSVKRPAKLQFRVRRRRPDRAGGTGPPRRALDGRKRRLRAVYVSGC